MRLFAAWIAAIAAIAILVLMTPLRVFLLDQYEEVAFAVHPTAALAFEYGERHLDATDPAEYDIILAQMYFKKAAALDPTYPYVYHELARISFLRGDYALALAQIDFQISLHGDSEPNSYYVRGLIEGYMGDYTDAAADYAHYITFDPHDWAAMNDYAWILLKAQQYDLAADVSGRGLQLFPKNPWLLNTNAIALYELGDLQQASIEAKAAIQASDTVTTEEWLRAYPGNDPSAAPEGIASLQEAASENMHTIDMALASSTIQLNVSHE